MVRPPHQARLTNCVGGDVEASGVQNRKVLACSLRCASTVTSLSLLSRGSPMTCDALCRASDVWSNVHRVPGMGPVGLSAKNARGVVR